MEHTLDLPCITAAAAPNVREYAAAALVSVAMLLLRVTALLALLSPAIGIAMLST